jgi:hypothetical protein
MIKGVIYPALFVLFCLAICGNNKYLMQFMLYTGIVVFWALLTLPMGYPLFKTWMKKKRKTSITGLYLRIAASNVLPLAIIIPMIFLFANPPDKTEVIMKFTFSIIFINYALSIIPALHFHHKFKEKLSSE